MATDPLHPRAIQQFNLGIAHHQAGRTADAEAAYRRAVDLAPELAPAWTNLGAALHALGRLDDAVAAFGDALAADGSFVPAHLGLGDALYAAGRAAEAVVASGRAIELAGDDPRGHAGLGRACLAAGDPERAIGACRDAIARAPASDTAREGLGLALLARGDIDAAIDELQRATALAPARASLWFELGLARARGGRFAAAAHAYQEAIDRDPDHAGALAALGSALRRLGRDGEAREACERALRLAPGDELAARVLAELDGDAPPPAYVRRAFDDYADRYDAHMVGELEYRAPQQLRALLLAHAPGRRWRAALDLGCGTGLLGHAIRDLVDELHGVDLSPRMLERARAAAVYDELHAGELLAHLQGSAARRYDLIAAADVLLYVGDAAPMIAEAARCLRAGGAIALSVEVGTGDEARVAPTGRYVHGDGHVRAAAARAGLRVARGDQVQLRKEGGVPVPGRVYLLTH